MSAPRRSWAADVARQATERPGVDAVVTDSRRCSYGELAATAGGIQRWLEALPPVRSAARRQVVAVLVSDPVDRAGAVVGVAAAGMAHVLLDPQRSAAAVQEASARIGATVAISDTTHEGFRATIDPEEVRGASLDPVVVHPDDPFAFVSTSGSTGDPKFVLLTHAVLAAPPNTGATAMRHSDRAFRAFNHSGNSLNILIDALRAGAAHLSTDPLRISATALLEFLSEEQATVVRMSPSLIRLVIRPSTSRDRVLGAARLVGGGGEAMLWSDVEALRTVAPAATITHGYASTETRGVTRKIIAVGDPLGHGAVPAGHPQPDRRVWIDAGDCRAAPPGTVGTIVVEGRFGTVGPAFESLADGSLRFRTGDIGELTASGELIHRGRADRVVNIGAVRIDLRAVEDVLRRAPGVVDVRAIPSSGPDALPGTDARLIAHVVVEPGCGLEVAALRDLARSHLTSAAVPVRFLFREDPLPLLASGKTDERSLKERLT